jgi:hypothetical protein
MNRFAHCTLHSTRNNVEEGVESFLQLFRCLYLVCLFLGAGLGAVMLAWSLGSWTGVLPAALDDSHSTAFFHTPWEGNGWSLIALYGLVVWSFYLLPAPKSEQQVHYRYPAKAPLKRPTRRGLGKHALLWAGVFGPLAHACGWYTGMSWQIGVIVIISLLCGFYIEVWQDLTKRREAETEMYQVVARARRHHAHA